MIIVPILMSIVLILISHIITECEGTIINGSQFLKVFSFMLMFTAVATLFGLLCSNIFNIDIITKFKEHKSKVL